MRGRMFLSHLISGLLGIAHSRLNRKLWEGEDRNGTESTTFSGGTKVYE
jgi:hypothetical protein